MSAEPLDPASGLKTVTLAYDYLSRRIQKTTYTYTAGAWILDTTTTFVYDGWNVIQATTTTGSSTNTAYYVWGLDLSGSLHGAGGVGGVLSTTNALTGTTRLYTFDANGNVGQLIDSSTGALAAHYEYDAFGNTLVASGPAAATNPIRFSTKWYLPEIEWYDYGKRLYDPLTGRWPSRDPIGEDGGWNLYGFVGNNPLQYIDPIGQASRIIVEYDYATGTQMARVEHVPDYPRMPGQTYLVADTMPFGNRAVLEYFGNMLAIATGSERNPWTGELLTPAARADAAMNLVELVGIPLLVETSGLSICEIESIQKGLDVADPIGAIVGKVTGARELPYWDFDGAEQVYDTIRLSSDDVARIAQNAGMNESWIKRIKDHLFYNKHISKCK